MKKLSVLLLSALMTVACSHKPEISVADSPIDFTLSELKGTQVLITFSPQDDKCRYMFDVISVEEYNSFCEKHSEREIMEHILGTLSGQYDDRCDMYREMGASYVAGFEDMAVYFGDATYFFIGLQPSTDYYVLAFCVDPFSRKPCGRLYRRLFTTTEISAEPSDMRLTFLVQDDGTRLYYYSKPTTPDARICRDPYLVDIVPDRILYAEPYNGDVEKYAYEWYMKMSEDPEVLRLFLHSDISREEVILVDGVVEGEGYTILGAPYNINNISALYSLHFIYRKGMYTEEYRNDQTGE